MNTSQGSNAGDVQSRKDAADVAKQEAEARKAAADASKAESEAEQAAYDQNSQLAKQKRDANARKEIASADKEAAAARREQLKALIPDFSAVKEGTIEVKDGPPLFGSVLTFGALGVTAKEIANRVLGGPTAIPRGSRVLITSEPDLASSDAMYRDVTSGLDQLHDAAQKLLSVSTPDKVETAGFLPGEDLVATLAGALPAVLSLLAIHRTLTTAASSVNDLAAATAVAGAVKGSPKGNDVTVVHDDFRLVPSGGIYAADKQVSTDRQELVARKLVLSDEKGRLDAELEQAKADKKTVEKEIADAGKTVPDELKVRLDDLNKQIDGVTRKVEARGLRIGLIDSLLASIDSFTAGTSVVPQGARRSAMATAQLFELLHTPIAGGAQQFSHVLLIKGQPGQSQQLIEHRAFFFNDKFSTMVDLSVTYMLIETSASSIVASGTVTSTAMAWGTIGEPPETKLGNPI